MREIEGSLMRRPSIRPTGGEPAAGLTPALPTGGPVSISGLGGLVNSEVLQIVFDYVDPGSYLTWGFIEQRRRRTGEAGGVSRTVRWLPLELRPLPEALQSPDEEQWKEMTLALAGVAESLALPFVPPGFLPRTRKAHELAFMAEEKGCFDRVHEALFEAHFVRGLDIGRVDVLVGIGSETGMDAAEVRTVLGVDRFLPSVDLARRRARELGVRGVPTLVRGRARQEGFPGIAELRGFLEEP